MIIFGSDVRMDCGYVEYLAWSEVFDVIADGDELPLYDIVIQNTGCSRCGAVYVTARRKAKSNDC
jgi:hypothetical protein